MKVLIGTDGSKPAASAARAACALPLPSPSQALVVSAAPSPRNARGTRTNQELCKWLLELAETAASEAAAIVAKRFASVEKRVVADDPRTAVLDAAREWKADLIVLGASGGGAVRSLLLGSVSVDVTRHTHCPVLVVRGEPSAFRTITIGIDGSEGALEAARFVARLALDADTRVRLVAVMEPPSFVAIAPDNLGAPLGQAYVTWTQEMRAELTSALDTAKRVFEGSKAKVETAFVDDRPARGLISECKEAGSDLVVLGARGLGGFERLLLGSVSDAVLHRAECSVLVVKKM